MRELRCATGGGARPGISPSAAVCQCDGIGPAQAPTEKVEEQPVVYSSALAKLRAKKMSKNKAPPNHPPSLLSLPFKPPENFLPAVTPILKPPNARPSVGEIAEEDFNLRAYRGWDQLLSRDWKYHMDDMFKELWVSQFSRLMQLSKTRYTSKVNCQSRFT